MIPTAAMLGVRHKQWEIPWPKTGATRNHAHLGPQLDMV